METKKTNKRKVTKRKVPTSGRAKVNRNKQKQKQSINITINSNNKKKAQVSTKSKQQQPNQPIVIHNVQPPTIYPPPNSLQTHEYQLLQEARTNIANLQNQRNQDVKYLKNLEHMKLQHEKQGHDAITKNFEEKEREVIKKIDFLDSVTDAPKSTFPTPLKTGVKGAGGHRKETSSLRPVTRLQSSLKETGEAGAPDSPVKFNKPRGRPPGSKNKPKNPTIVTVPVDTPEVKL